MILWIRLRLPNWSRNRRDTATARTEPHRRSQRASGYFCDNDFEQGFCATFKEYRASIRFRDTETIDQGLNQNGRRHWVPNPEALYF